MTKAMGLPRVVKPARLNRLRQLSAGRQEVETVWLITSLSAEQAGPQRLLEPAGRYWSIENGTRYRLDTQRFLLLRGINSSILHPI